MTLKNPGHPTLRDENGICIDTFLKNGTYEHSGEKRLFGVGKYRPQGNGTGALIYRDF